MPACRVVVALRIPPLELTSELHTASSVFGRKIVSCSLFYSRLSSLGESLLSSISFFLSPFLPPPRPPPPQHLYPTSKRQVLAIKNKCKVTAEHVDKRSINKETQDVPSLLFAPQLFAQIQTQRVYVSQTSLGKKHTNEPLNSAGGLERDWLEDRDIKPSMTSSPVA